MQTESSALVDTRFRTKENLHPAQWAAQVVLGYRAFRRLVNVGSAGAQVSRSSEVRLGLGAGRQVRALPPHEPDGG